MSSIVILSEHSNLIEEFQSKFKQSIDYIKAFHVSSEAEDYIKKSEDYVIIFIISIEFDEIVIKHLHNLRQLHQIYVYNSTNATDSWTKNYQKVCIQKKDERYTLKKDVNKTIIV
jgi:hypothetical protein